MTGRGHLLPEKSKGSNYDEELRFTGTATIKSKLGVEDDRVSGLLKSSDGSAFWSSADDRYDQKIPVTLHRKQDPNPIQ